MTEHRHTPAEEADGIWTMTDTEFRAELAKAWDEGAACANRVNPYSPRSAKELDRGEMERLVKAAFKKGALDAFEEARRRYLF